MKMRFLPLVFLAAFLAAGPTLRAQEGPHYLALASGISLEQAVKMAEQRFKARVVRAETQQSEGHTVYVLRMLNESGRVWTVRVDASSGAVL
jgi:uncharacterized membrane protein YkoI